MPRSETLHALILQTHDVGEADRFCILLTRERGKIAARARGVRKLGSRMGGSLMKGKHVQVSVYEGSAGCTVTGVKLLESRTLEEFSIPSFLEAEQGIELLLALLQDEEPLPEIYEGTLEFLQTCAENKTGQLLPYTLFVLHFLGSLPETSHESFHFSSDAGKEFLRQSKKGMWNELPPLSEKEQRAFSHVCSDIIHQHGTRPLKAEVIAQTMLRQKVPTQPIPSYQH